MPKESEINFSMPSDETRKSAMVGVVGRTNAGKSTVVNRMVGEKVSIVSPVVQTTRNTIRGIVEDERGQLVLLDTPGLHKAVGHLGKLLNGMARASSAGVDILLVVFDAAHAPQLEDRGWMERVSKECPEKCVFALNKSDKAPFFETMFRDMWKEVAALRGEECTCSPIWVKTSGVRENGCDELLDALYSLAEVGPALFPEDIVTDYPRKLAISDTIREKYLQRLHGEVPHEVGVLVTDIKECDGRWDVAATIYVNRKSQKAIVIGPGGKMIKDVRLFSQRELSMLFDVKVRLELWVKVEPNWMENKTLLTEMGYMGARQ